MTRNTPSKFTLFIILAVLLISIFIPPKAHAEGPEWRNLGTQSLPLQVKPGLMQDANWQQLESVLRQAPHNDAALTSFYEAHRAAYGHRDAEAMKWLMEIYSSGLNAESIALATPYVNGLLNYFLVKVN